MLDLKKIIREKSLVTGHTGFRFLLVVWLNLLGSKIWCFKGYVSKPSHYDLLNIKKNQKLLFWYQWF